MEQEISPASIDAAPSAHALRLVLMFLGAVLGLLVLSFVFGSSSASADDGGDSGDSVGSALGGVVAQVATPVQTTVHTVTDAVSHTNAAVTHAAPAVAPVTKAATDAVAAVAGLIDESLGDVGDAIRPVVAAVSGDVDTSAVTATRVAASAPLLAATAVIDGVAHGTLNVPSLLPGGGDPGVSGTSPAGTGLFATAIAGGLFVLLAVRRQTLSTPGMPGSPVYETDSSPD